MDLCVRIRNAVLAYLRFAVVQRRGRLPACIRIIVSILPYMLWRVPQTHMLSSSISKRDQDRNTSTLLCLTRDQGSQTAAMLVRSLALTVFAQTRPCTLLLLTLGRRQCPQYASHEQVWGIGERRRFSCMPYLTRRFRRLSRLAAKILSSAVQRDRSA